MHYLSVNVLKTAPDKGDREREGSWERSQLKWYHTNGNSRSSPVQIFCNRISATRHPKLQGPKSTPSI